MQLLRKFVFIFLYAISLICVAGPAVDINTADSEALVEGLVGIGPQKAMAIVRHRQEHGPFRRVEDLSLVKGIGERTVEQNRANITISSVPVGNK